eukprot:CAMPEP_0202884864 /NCGR_PEP_ID=MMETSP1391-20130828/41369_1 /ASSEMBLY_ACC=CAM_ASM_000867 /TAXON_ID=1034604 /ORGANISM="Chlamydomonas leiostraca, Strain SAG 11-49" /LENGTH=701 /DNA_ID=CAMNT_0049568097 /DNA_START=242 /DNA_END=2347 /DNA_ORIENTATION=+
MEEGLVYLRLEGSSPTPFKLLEYDAQTGGYLGKESTLAEFGLARLKMWNNRAQDFVAVELGVGGHRFTANTPETALRVTGPAAAAAQPPAAPPDAALRYLQRVTAAGPPSEAAGDVNQFMTRHQGPSSPQLLNLRPATAASPVPVQLAVPCLQPIAAAATPGTAGGSEPEERDLYFAMHLCQSMSGAFSSETARVKRFLHMLRHYFGDAYVVHEAQAGERLPDIMFTSARAATSGAHPKKEQPWLLAVVAKVEPGKSGDAALQNQLYYAEHVQRLEIAHGLLASSSCPMLLAELVGPNLRFSGAAMVVRVVCQPLTPMLNLLALQHCHREQVVTMARTLAAVHGALPKLAEGYAAALPAAPPAGGPAWGRSVVPMPHHLQEHVLAQQATVQLLGHPGRMVYLVRNGKELPGHPGVTSYVVKYCQQYGEAVHRAWAAARYAPALLSVEPVGGGWLAVFMEFLGPQDMWYPLSAVLPQAITPAAVGSSGSAGGGGGETDATVQAIRASFGGARTADLHACVRDALVGAHRVPIPSSTGGQAEDSALMRDAKRHGGVGVHGDARPFNILVKFSHLPPAAMQRQQPQPAPLLAAGAAPGSSAATSECAPSSASTSGSSPLQDAPVQVQRVALIDFDWAGVEGSARYPPFLHPAVPWPPGVGAGALIQQVHDRQLLEASLRGEVGARMWPWEADASMGLGAAIASD